MPEVEEWFMERSIAECLDCDWIAGGDGQKAGPIRAKAREHHVRKSHRTMAHYARGVSFGVPYAKAIHGEEMYQ